MAKERRRSRRRVGTTMSWIEEEGEWDNGVGKRSWMVIGISEALEYKHDEDVVQVLIRLLPYVTVIIYFRSLNESKSYTPCYPHSHISLILHHNLRQISSMISSVFAFPPRSGDNNLPSSNCASTAS